MLFDKAICFSDIHFGLKGNSKQHNEDCLEFINFTIDEATQRGIKTAVFLGDWYHNRHNLNIETLKYSTEAMKRLNNAFDKVYFIEGNHDLYYRENRSLSSVRSTGSLLENFVMINEPMTEGDVTFLPWLVGDEWKAVKKNKSKYVFGHFELPTFLLNQMVEMPETNQLHGEDFTNASYVFSGHFHKRQNKANVWYIGNCFPHDFADVNDDERGCMVFEWDEAPEFIRWDNAPRYRRYNYDRVINNLELLSEPKIHVKIDYISGEVSPSQLATLRDEIKEKYDIRSLKFVDVSVTSVLEDSDEETDESEVTHDHDNIDTTVVRHLRRMDSNQYDISLLEKLYNEL